MLCVLHTTWALRTIYSHITVYDPGGSICVESSDNVIFQIDGSYLNVLSENWPNPDGSAASNLISLPEDSSTLHLLFHFINPSRLPDLQKQDIGVIDALGTAAEKYKIRTAMNVCKIIMKFSCFIVDLFRYLSTLKGKSFQNMPVVFSLMEPDTDTSISLTWLYP
jgi:hypothetical protein